MSSPVTVTRVQVEDPFQGSVYSLATTGTNVAGSMVSLRKENRGGQE